MMQGRVSSVCSLIVALVVVGASWSTAHAASSSTPTIRLNTLLAQSWVPSLDPAFADDISSTYVDRMIYAGLVKLLPGGKVVPDLAGWKVSKDKRAYTFSLRRHLRFSNGDSLGAADVVFSLMRALSPSTGSSRALVDLGHIAGVSSFHAGKSRTISGLKVLSGNRIQIKLDAPIAYLLEALAQPEAAILDRRALSKIAPDTGMTTTCSADVGAGQMMPSCRAHERGMSSFYRSGTTPTLTLVPNPRYYGSKARVRVEMPAISNAESNYRDFEAGKIDETMVPEAVESRYRGKHGFYLTPSASIHFLTPDLTHPPFNDVHCRLAVAYAIDRETLARRVLQNAFALYDIVPPHILGSYSGKDNPGYSQTRARAELARCRGGINGVDLPYVATTTSDAEYRALAAMWESVGIDLRPTPMSYSDWLHLVTQPLARTHTAIVDQGWVEDYPDPQDYCGALLHSGAPANIGGFKDSHYDSLVDKAAVTSSSSTRARLYEEAQHIALGDGAIITINGGEDARLLNTSIHGIVTSAILGLVPKNNDWSQIRVSGHG